MLFNSTEFLLFFPIVVMIYYALPHKVRYVWIFASSYFFYMCWNVSYGFLLLGVSLLTYLVGLAIDTISNKAPNIKKPAVCTMALCLSVVSCLLILGVFKYSAFIALNLQKCFGILKINFNVPQFSIVLPVGISFYLFQSLGYVIDVYKGRIRAEKNFVLYAAFISFFPQLVAGPIERAEHLLHQFREKHSFDYDRVKNNLLLMLWGLFLKIVIADRAAIFVDIVYNDFANYDGYIIAIASVLFAFQIYCDFAGYSAIAIGAAGVMGFELMDNFKSPYCAIRVRDFWARWHISLTGWFRDYVYIPLGGNRKGKFRKTINTLIVFLLSGLWHGGSWSYVIWGGLNGFFIVVEDCFKKLDAKITGLLKSKVLLTVVNVFRTIITFVLIDFTWVFFRATGTKEALQIFNRMVSVRNIDVLFDNTIHFYIMEKHRFAMLIVFILVLIIVDICHNMGVRFRNIIARRNIVIRWSCYLGLIMVLLIFGVWGPGFNESAFIYFQF